MISTDPPDSRRLESDGRALLCRVAELLHSYGAPAFRLERVLEKLARSLRIRASFLSTPTAIFASFENGERQDVYLLRGDAAETNLGKLVEFDDVLDDVEHRTLSPGDAKTRLDEIAAAPPRYGLVAKATAFGVASGGAASFFGGGYVELSLAFFIGVAISIVASGLPRRPWTIGLFEPIAALVASATATIATATGLEVERSVVTLAGLIVVVPGLTLTVGLTELATRHLVSGVSRLAGAAATFLMMLFGTALGWRVLGPLLSVPVETAAQPTSLPPWVEWFALACVPFAFACIFDARRKELPIIFATGVGGYLAARAGVSALGPDLAASLGAFVVGIGSNLYARVADRPAIVPMTPGILLLVPGSLGLRSLTSFLDHDAIVGVEWAFQTGLVAVSIVGGLLAANVIVPPRRIL